MNAQTEGGLMQHEILRDMDFPSTDTECLTKLVRTFVPRTAGLQHEVVQLV